MLDVGAFNFPLAVDALDSPGSYAFRGTVQLTAHGGLLAVTLRDPQLDIQEDTATLSVDSGTGHPLVLCTLEGGAYEASEKTWSGPRTRFASQKQACRRSAGSTSPAKRWTPSCCGSP